MKRHLSSWIFLVVLISMAGWWTSPASARLYPPCRTITYILDDTHSPPQSIQYSVTDPLTGETRLENWAVSDQEGFIVPTSVKAEGGILTWIAYDGLHQVHYRIFDPGRGVWKGGHWSTYPDYDFYVSIDQHQVKDGVVAFKVFGSGINLYEMGGPLCHLRSPIRLLVAKFPGLAGADVCQI